MDRKQVDLRECDVKGQQLVRQVSHSEDKIRRLQQQTAQKRETLDAKLEKLRYDWDKVGVDRSTVQEQLVRYEAATVETKQKVWMMFGEGWGGYGFS